MKFSIFYFLLFFSVSVYAQEAKISSDKLRMIGGQYVGFLSYTDYSDDSSQTKLSCDANIYWERNKAKFTTAVKEPNGTMYHDVTCFKISRNGKKVKFNGDKYEVLSFENDQDKDQIKLVLEGTGKDNYRSASIRQTLLYNKNELSFVKEVKYDGSASYFTRNQYILSEE